MGNLLILYMKLEDLKNNQSDKNVFFFSTLGLGKYFIAYL